jgi:fructose-bisphosphate aldolase class II
MPLTSVRDLVQHASRHGYMVASFTVHGAEEIQAIVTAAEANRAPAIVAVDIPGTALANRDVCITVAESVAARAAVPIGIEIISMPALHTPPVFRHATHIRATGGDSVSEEDTIPCDLEVWLPTAEWPDSAAEVDRIGVDVCDDKGRTPGSADLRKQLQAFSKRFDGPLVVDGDASWRHGVFYSLPNMGVSKINFDRCLRKTMAQANRRVAQKAGDDFRCAMDHVSAALVAEVTACLRRTGGTGRAADVMACAPNSVKQDDQDAPDPRFQRHDERCVPAGLVQRAGTRLSRMRAVERDEHMSFAQ